MHLTFSFVFGIVLHNNLPSESKKITPDGIVLEGFTGDALRRITTHLIEINVVNKLGLCALKCLKNHECVSFNFGNPVNGQHVCELLRTDKYNSRSSYVTSTDYHHFYPGNKCMDPSPCQNNGSCYPDYDNDDYKCVCNGTKGKHCEIFYRDCSKIRSDGYTTNGMYTIDPDGQGLFPVYCDMAIDGHGWTVIQKRFNGMVNFYRGWQDFKTGFGNLNGEFWLGNDKIHRLTKIRQTAIHVDIEDWDGNTGYALYSLFAIANESDSYRLDVGGYSGTAGDSLKVGFKQKPQFAHIGMQFSTLDRDNDMASAYSCAVYFHGAWWHNSCFSSHLNGKYVANDKLNSNDEGMCWWSFRDDCRSLKKTQMKLK